MTESVLPISVLIDLYIRLRDEIAPREDGLDQVGTIRWSIAMAVMQASVLIPNDILRIEEEARLLLQLTVKKDGNLNDGNQQTVQKRHKEQQRRILSTAAERRPIARRGVLGGEGA